MTTSSNISSSHKLIKLLTPKEYDDLYGVPIFSDEERTYFFALSPSDEKLRDSFRNLHDKIYFLLSLGYFRAKNSLINFNLKSAKNDSLYLIATYFSDVKFQLRLPEPKQQTRIQNKILDHEKSTRWTQTLQKELDPILYELIRRHPKARPLTKAFLHHLSQQRVALPSYSTLQRIITKTMSHEKKRLFQTYHKFIKPEEQLLIQRLLMQEETLYSITAIKQDVKDFGYTELCKEIKKHALLQPLFYVALKLIEHTDLPKKIIEHYGSLVNFYSVYKLKRMPMEQAHWYLLCYTYIRYQKINDNLVQFFQYHVNVLNEESNAHTQEKLLQLHLEMDKLLVKAGQVLQLFTDNTQNLLETQNAFQILSPEKMLIVQKFLLGKTRDEALFYWTHVDSLLYKIQRYLRPLFLAVNFSTSQESKLSSIIPIMKEFLQKGEDLPKNNPALLKVIPKKLLPYLVKDTENGGAILWSRFEFLVYKTIATHLKTKKAFLTHSLHYKTLDEELIAEPVWQSKKSVILENLGYPKLLTPIEKLLENYHKELDPLIVSVNDHIHTGDNEHVKLKQTQNGPHWALPYQKKTEEINNPFFLQLPQINIVELLYFVDHQSGFLNAFTPIQPHSLKQERKDSLVLASILGNAIRMGTYKMASCAFLNLHELLTTEKTYLRVETLREAVDIINNATAKLSIFPYWDIYDKLHSSLDGSKIGTRLHTLKARHSPKYYGLEKGVSSYNLITNHLPINGRTIGANEHESHFAFPIVYNNTSDINPLQHSGDGHSINHLNFTLFDTIGHQYMPHFPSIQKKAIYCFEDLKLYKDAVIKPTHQIRPKLIASEWSQIQHIIASVLQGETDQSAVIRILSSHDYHSKTKEALWEYDNILKSIYILNYIDDIHMRQGVRKALNRGESYHQLCRAIACINGGRFRGKSELELEIWNECARLIASAIIFYNAYILSHLLEDVYDEKQANVVKQLSPVAWTHINFLGQYEFNQQSSTLEIERWIKNVRINEKEFVI